MPTTDEVEATPPRCHGDTGASLVEYALLLALIALVCVTAVVFLGDSLDSNLSRSGSSLFST